MGQAKEDVWLWSRGSRDVFGDPSSTQTDMFGDPLEAPPVEEPEAAGGGRPDGVPASALLVRATVWPRSAADNSSREIVNGAQNTVIVGLSALLPAGTVVRPDDQAYVRGAFYEVEGEPGDYRKRGMMLALRRVQG